MGEQLTGISKGSRGFKEKPGLLPGLAEQLLGPEDQHTYVQVRLFFNCNSSPSK